MTKPIARSELEALVQQAASSSNLLVLSNDMLLATFIHSDADDAGRVVHQIFGLVVGPDGSVTPDSKPFLIAWDEIGSAALASVAQLDDGRLAAAWTSTHEGMQVLKARALNIDGSDIGPVVTVAQAPAISEVGIRASDAGFAVDYARAGDGEGAIFETRAFGANGGATGGQGAAAEGAGADGETLEKAASSSESMSASSDTATVFAGASGGGGPGPEPEEIPPQNIRVSGSLTIEENPQLNTSLGQLLADDPSGPITYTLSGSTAFDVQRIGTSNSYELIVKDPAQFNYEANQSHTISVTVTAKDFFGNTASQLITFTLTDKAELPANLTLSAAPINENAPQGTRIGSLSGISNEGGPLVWELLGSAASAFRIVNNGTNNASLEVLDPAALDYESSGGLYRFDMRARSTNGQAWKTETFTLSINNVAENPSNLDIFTTRSWPSHYTLSELSQPGERVADIRVVDDAADLPHLQYSISGAGAQYFDIDYSSSVPGLKLKPGVHFDYATNPWIWLTVTVRDPNTNATITRDFQLQVWNDDEAPTIAVTPGTEHAVASTIGDVVKPFSGVTLSDPDDLDTPDFPDILTLKITFAQGRGMLSNVSSLVTVDNNADGTVTYTLRDTAAKLQAILHNIGFNPDNGVPGTTTLTLTLLDQGAASVSYAVVYVDAIANNAPTLSVDAGTELVYLSDDQAPAPAFGNIHLGDLDNNDLTLTVSFVNANGILSNVAGVAGVFVDNVDGVLSADGLTRTFTFHGKAAALEQLLAQLKWNQTDGVFGNTRFTLTLSDGITTVTNDARQVAINAAPTINIADGTTSTPAVDNGSPVKPFRGIDLDDRENDTLIVKIGFLGSHGTLAGATGATTHVGSDGLLYYIFQGKASDLDAILRNITFDPRNGVANTTQFHISVEDGKHAPVLDLVQVVTSTAAGSTNAAPTIFVDPQRATIQATDTGPDVSPFLGVTLADAEGDILTVTVSFDLQEGRLFNFPAIPDATYNGSVVTYTIRGTAANVQAILHNLLFDPQDGQANETTFTITVKDDAHQALVNNQIKVVTEIAGGPGSNQAPVLNVIDGMERTPGTDTGSPVTPFLGVQLSDADGDELTVTVSFLNSHGTLGNLDISSALYFGTTLDGDLRTFTFKGSAQDLQALIRSLTFNPVNGVANTTHFSITAKDALHQAIENHEIYVETLASGGGANTAPVITVSADTAVTNATDNGPAVYPFRGVDLDDAENDILTVTVSFLDERGVLGNAELGTSTLVNGIRTYTFTGRPGDVEALLHNLTFNPTNDSALNGPVSTGFTITVKDDQHQAVGSSAIHVETSHGTGTTNRPPIISVSGTGETPATDTGAPVSPFSNVTLLDLDGDSLTLTVSFRQADGALINTGAAIGISVKDGTITYTFSGTASALQTILRGLAFSPKDGVANTTTFTLGLQDAYHAPVTDSRVKVVTSLSGTTSNQPPQITVAQKVFNTLDTVPVTPFSGVDLLDQENNVLTVTVSFLDVRGILNIMAGSGVTLADNGVGLGGLHSFTLTGKADDIEQVLKAASFDPADGISNSTNFTIAVKDDYHQAVTNQDIVVNSTSANAPSAPTWTNGQTTISIAENATALPFRIQATDPNGDPVHYALVPTLGSQNNLFIVDPDGQIRLAPNARLDFESGSVLNIYVRAIDSNGLEGPVQKLTIRLTDVDEAPSAPLVEDGGISENTTGYVTRATDSEDPEQFGVTYEWDESVPDALRALFHLDEETGEISVISALNHESPDLLSDGTNRYYELKVVARDGTGMQLSQPTTFRVNVLDQNEALTDAVFSVVPSIGQNAPANTIVASVVRVDDPDRPGPNENFRFSLVKADGTAYSGPFSIDALTGQITVSGPLPGPASVTLHVKIADHGGVGGYSIVRPVTFAISPANPNNRAPTIQASSATFTIADGENINLVKPFAGVTIADPDTGDTITVTVTAIGQAGGAFVDALGVAHERTYTFSGTLQNVLSQLQNLKFNPTDRPGAPNGSNDPTTFSIQVQDNQGASVSITPDITVNSIHRTNVAPDVSATGPIEWTTPDNVAVQAFQNLVFRDDDTDPVTGQVTVEIWYDPANGTLVNVTAGTHDGVDGHYVITGTLQQVNAAVAALRFSPWNKPVGTAPVTTDFLVRITDGGSARDEITVTVHATSNDAPSNIHLDGTVEDRVAEDLGVGEVVGNLSATDENPAGLTYVFADGFNGAGHFEIAGRQIKVKKALNFEDPIVTTPGTGLEQDEKGRFYRLKVVATDSAGQPSATPQEIKVYVDNVNEAPVLQVVQDGVIDETLPGGGYVAELIAVDPEGDSVSFTFANNSLISPDGAFRIEGNQIVRTNAVIQFASGGEDRDYTITVTDPLGAMSTSIIRIHINDTGNIAPIAGITGNIINEDTGFGQSAGTLTGIDPDAGDTIDHFTLVDDCGGLFTIGNFGGSWEVIVNGVIDYENDPRLHEGFDEALGRVVKWYEIKVTATDNHGLGSAPQTLKIFIEDVNPDNTAPEIRVAPNGTTFWQIGDTDTVAPLRDISFFDAEDGAANPPAPIFAGFDLDDSTSGSLIVPPASQFPDLEIFWDPTTPTSVWVQGAQDQVTAFLKLVQFDPWNRPGEAGTVRTSHFKIMVYDSAGAWSTRTVTVEATATGQSVNNAPPVIQVDPAHASTHTTDHALNPVKPFEFVTLSDANPADTLTVTVSFNRLDGTLGGAGQDGVVSGNTITYTFSGSAAAANAWLTNLTFDATNQDAPGPDVTTRFTISVNDGHHGVPVTNTDVTVVTTVTGPGDNHAPVIDLIAAAGDGVLNGSGAADEIGKIVVRRDLAAGAVAKVTAHDEDGDTLHYSLESTSGGLFAINDATGQISIVNASLLPAGTSDYVLTVKVFDGHVYTTQNVTVRVAAVTVPDGNDAPVIDAIAAAGDGVLNGSGAPAEAGKIVVHRDLALGSVAQVVAHDEDGDTLGYSLGDTFGGLFAINDATGRISIVNAANLPAATTDYGLEVRVFDGHQYTTQTVTVRVTIPVVPPGNDAPVIESIERAGDAVQGDPSNPDEIGKIVVRRDLAEGVVAQVTASDDENDPLVYSLESTFGGLFVIDGSGRIIITDDSLLPAATTDYGLEVRVFDGHQYTTQTVTVRVTKVVVPPGNHAPVIDSVAAAGDAAAGNPSNPDEAGKIVVRKDLAAGLVAQVNAHDEDAGDPLVYSLENTFNDLFTIDANGRILIANAGNLPATTTDYGLEVRVFDGHQYTTQTVTVRVAEVVVPPGNHAPVIDRVEGDGDGVLSSGVIVVDKALAEGVVAKVVASDADVGDTLGYSLGDTFGGLFSIDAATGRIGIVNAANLPAGNSDYVLEVRVFDGHQYTTRNVTVHIDDSGTPPTNHLPSAPTLTQDFFFEGDGEGTLIANLESTDVDGDQIDYWIVNSQGQLVKDDGRFKIVGGELQISNPLMFDSETNPLTEIKLVATDDRGGVSSEITHAISILDWIGESILGDGGGNRILGYVGGDNLSGGAGNDTLSGGIGRDVLTGGEGSDVFLFDTAAAANNTDTIVDFKASEGDKIHLKWDIFRLGSGNVGHALSDAQFFSGSPTSGSMTASTRIIYEKTASVARLWYDRDGSGTQSDAKLIAIFTTDKPDLRISDFLIV